MTAITFPARSVLRLDGSFISEHSRSPLEVSFEQIENANRTVNGHMRVYAVAKKYNLSTSWQYLPSRAEYTVDGYMGGLELERLYTTKNSFRVEIWNDAEAAKTEPYARVDFMGRITSFNYSIEKRNLGGVFYDFWNASISIEEL